MTLVAYENWDSATVPALASGWNTDGNGIGTYASVITPITSPNMVLLGHIVYFTPAAITFATTDGNGGDCLVTGTGLCNPGTGGTFSVLARGNASTLVYGTSNFYEARFNFGTGELDLVGNVGASATTIASSTGISISAASWYLISFQLVGTALTVAFQRVGDSKWWYGGAWNTAAGNAISVTDATITGAGYAGWGAAATTESIYGDDWSLSTAGAVNPTVTPGTGVFTLTGEAADLVHSWAASSSPGTFSLAGEFANLQYGHVAAMSPGNIAMTGESADLLTGGVVRAAPGSFAFTGESAGLLHTHVLHANPGNIVVAGEAVSLGSDTTLTAAPGVFELIPTTAGLTALHEIFADSAAFVVTGQSALLYPGVTLFASPGVFTEARIPAGLTAARELYAAPGSFTETGKPVVLEAGVTLDAAAAVFTVDGEAAPITVAHELDAGSTAFELTGEPASFTTQKPVGPPSGIAYYIYSNTGIGDPIDYDTPIAVAYGTTWTSQPVAGPSEWAFGVRAFDSLTGLEELNLDCAVDVDLDAEGDDVTATPSAPVALTLLARPNGVIRVQWAYPNVNTTAAPTGFHVYMGPAGAVNYAVPVATVRAVTGLTATYSTLIPGGLNGVAYSVGVRAYNASAEEQNTYTATVTALSVGPRAVVGLTASLTS